MTTINGGSVARWMGACPPGDAALWVRCTVAPCRSPMRSDGLGCTSGHRLPVPELVYYATWTQTERNLKAIHGEGVRLITGPDQLGRVGARELPPLAWGLDNGAWGCYSGGRAWDVDAFRRALDRWAQGADWVVAPDVVAGGLESLALSLSWLPELRQRVPLVLLAVQDGMEPGDLEPHLGPGLGLFLGGSTAWKWRTLATWAGFARAQGVPLHVGRVNSAQAIRRCVAVGATSADGTTMSRYAVNAPVLGVALRERGQEHLFRSSP